MKRVFNFINLLVTKDIGDNYIDESQDIANGEYDTFLSKIQRALLIISVPLIIITAILYIVLNFEYIIHNVEYIIHNVHHIAMVVYLLISLFAFVKISYEHGNIEVFGLHFIVGFVVFALVPYLIEDLVSIIC